MSMSSSSTASFMSSSSMSSAPSSGKTKTDQVVLEFFYKAVEMILQARGPKLSANKEARQRRARVCDFSVLLLHELRTNK